jgi:hypothetical protein
MLLAGYTPSSVSRCQTAGAMVGYDSKPDRDG